MISTLNLFSWNIASASSRLTTTLSKRCFSFMICAPELGHGLVAGPRPTCFPAAKVLHFFEQDDG